MVLLTLDDEEVVFLKDVLTIWGDGLRPCKDELAGDPLVETLEQLLSLNDGYLDQERLLRSIQDKLSRERNERT